MRIKSCTIYLPTYDVLVVLVYFFRIKDPFPFSLLKANQTISATQRAAGGILDLTVRETAGVKY